MIRYYVRVSTVEQKIDRQLQAYKEADKIYVDKMSGKNKERPQLKLMLDELQPNDIVVVKSFDRLSRSLADLITIVEEIHKKQAMIKVLDNNIETNTATGKFFMQILGAVAELERNTIRQRTKEGIEIAKQQGKFKGRKNGSIELKTEQLKRFKEFYNAGLSKATLAKEFNVTRKTIYNWIRVLKDRGEIK